MLSFLLMAVTGARAGVECTTADIGKILCSDGSIYATVGDASSASKTPVAMIAYVDMVNKNGLAIALDEVYWKGLSLNDKGTNNDGKTAAQWLETWALDNAVTFGTWRIPTVDDWKNMMKGCGGSATGEGSPGYDEGFTYGAFRDYLKDATYKSVSLESYWSSTPYYEEVSYRYYSFNLKKFGVTNAQGELYVRGCLAFDISENVPVTSVTLNAATQTVDIDDAVGLSATVNPSNATSKLVRWNASNSNVKLYFDTEFTMPVTNDAATDKLVVYAKGVTYGFTDVTVTSDADPSKTAICKVTVPAPLVVLSESEDNSAWIAANKGKTYSVQLIRTVKGGYWNTFAVPFNVNHDQMISLFGEGGYVKGLRESNYSNGNLTLIGGSVWSIVAGTAYLVKTEYDLVNPIFYNVVISDQIYTNYVSSAYVDLIPTLGKTQVGSPGDDPKSILYLGSGNKLYKPSSLPAAMLGFRGYFKLKSSIVEVSSFNLDIDENTTGISLQLKEEDKRSDSDVYNLSGQRVARPTKGLYIVNGKKVVIK